MSEKYYNQFIGIGRQTLPVLVKPLPDELLSSWIMRYSKELLTKSHTFCKFILKSENVWNRDIDLNASEEFIAALADKSFLRFQDVYETTLKSYHPNLFVGVHRKWIIPIGVYHRTRRNAGQMVCPKCFKKDAIPYYRRKWRLSLSVVCPDCRINLIERCPKCNVPISFHRLEVGIKESILAKEICICHKCLFDFRDSKVKKADESMIEFQKNLYSTLDNGFNEVSQYSHLYFDVIYQLNRIINSSQEKFIEFDKELSKRSGLKFTPSIARVDFDKRPIDERSVSLAKVNWLIEKWPERLIDLSNDLHFYSSYLLRDFGNPPYWYWKEVKQNTYVVYTEWRSDSEFSSLASYNVYSKKKLNSS